MTRGFAGYAGKIFRPQYYQGRGKSGTYFEGWYFKQEINDICYSFIAGIALEPDPHSFIQVIRHNKGTESRYFRFHINEFSAREDELFIEIAGNIFSSRGLRLNLEDGEYRLKCDISFGHFTNAPNAMGVFALIPNLQCNHAIISMAHTLYGKITENNNEIPFDNGIGYIEKDFGTAFPEKYLWLHSNIRNEFIVTLARATVPLGKITVDGHICFIKHRDKLYNLSTYAMGKVFCCKYTGDKFVFGIKRGRTVLNIELECGESMPLQAPGAGGMDRVIHEGLCFNVRFDFSAGNKVFYQGEGCAAFEHADT